MNASFLSFFIKFLECEYVKVMLIVKSIFCSLQIANTNNCLSFGEYMKQLKMRYLKEDDDVKEDDDTTSIRKDRFQILADTFHAIGKIG